MRIRCRTYFDCSPTGVTGHCKPGNLPFVDKTGNTIRDMSDWNRARNQQRNWETVMQLISLRALPYNIAFDSVKDGVWHFEFEVDHDEAYGQDHDFSSLLVECHGVPMVTGLEETLTKQPSIHTHGPDQNLWFELVNN